MLLTTSDSTSAAQNVALRREGCFGEHPNRELEGDTTTHNTALNPPTTQCRCLVYSRGTSVTLLILRAIVMNQI
jgi:hypothetical protein